MNNLYKLILILPILIIGCAPKIIEEKDFAKEINNLDLNIFSTNGEKKYTITSPHSIYDNFKNKFHFQETTINIFEDEKIKYIIECITFKINSYIFICFFYLTINNFIKSLSFITKKTQI